MRLFIALGLLWLITGEPVQGIAGDQWSTEPIIGNSGGSLGLNEQETTLTKRKDVSEDQPKIKDYQNKDVLGTGAKETASDEIAYGSYTTHAIKNGIPVTLEFSSNRQPEFEVKSNSHFKQSTNNAGDFTVKSNNNEKKSEDRTHFTNNDDIHELSASFKEAKVIHEEGSEETDSAHSAPLMNDDKIYKLSDRIEKAKIIHEEGSEETYSAHSAPLMNDDKIYELSDTIEEAKIIHEEGSEETDSAGVIHGKYTYTLEHDGIPTTIEYEASPEIGFIVKHFYKQNNKAKENSKLKLKANNPMDSTNPKNNPVKPDEYKIAALETEIPSYEHSVVLAKYKPRFRRSDDSTKPIIPDSTIKSPSPPGEEDLVDPVLYQLDREVPVEITKVKNPDELESNQSFDASYKFGFSVDSQSRNEESDGKGNVIGSYSYVDYDGLMTKVEYEAGANKGFVVKRISHEQLESLAPKESKRRTNNAISFEVEQQTEAHVGNEKEAEKYSDEVILNSSPSDAKRIPDSISSENQASNLENEYNAEDKAFSMYGLPMEDHSIPPIDLEIRRAIAISERNNQLNNKRNRNFRKVNRRPIKPNDNGNFISMMPDGSYAFAYQTKDHARREYVDSLGNVHSSYHKNTKQDGTTVVVFERRGLNKANINKQTNLNNGNNNILSRPKSREAPVKDDDYNNQPHNPTGEQKIHSEIIQKYTGVADYIMRNSSLV